MGPIGSLAMSIMLLFSSTEGLSATPKVTQAEFVEFKKNRVIVLALEEFGKPPSLKIYKHREVLFSADYENDFRSFEEFAYTNSFLRFKVFTIEGFPCPILVAVAVSPGGSDTAFGVRLISENKGKIQTLHSNTILLTTQDRLFLGPINKEYGSGMVTAKFQWDDAHYAPHAYEIEIYTINPASNMLVLR